MFNRHQLNNLYPARDEFEMCQLFEYLLFKKYALPQSASWEITRSGQNLLHQLGNINHIFRRWHQLTWGIGDWTYHFNGETPRQELARLNAKYAQGRRYLHVSLEKQTSGFSVRSRVYDTEEAGEEFFIYAFKQFIRQSRAKIYAPCWDIGVNDFFDYLLRLEKGYKGLRRQPLPKDVLGKYWSLFWSQAGASLVFKLKLNLPKNRLAAISLKIQSVLNQYFASQGDAEDDFLSTDILFGELWKVLENSDKKLLSYKKSVDSDYAERQMKLKNKDRRFIYSESVFFRLGIAFDELILFPLDWYFGGAEIAWTDKMNFMQDLAVGVELLNNNLKLELKQPIDKREFFDMSDYSFNIQRLWFTPPTSFRLLEPVRKFFIF